jgi:hypothetical protein
MEKRQQQQFKYTSFWKEADDNILFWDYAPNTEIDISIAKELIKNRLEYSKGELMYAFIDFTNVKSVTKEARDYMNSPEGGLKGIFGGAFLSNNIVSNVFINLYLKINKPSIPAKFFTRKEDALSWLKELKKH